MLQGEEGRAVKKGSGFRVFEVIVRTVHLAEGVADEGEGQQDV
jgi:hypothetical protein